MQNIEQTLEQSLRGEFLTQDIKIDIENEVPIIKFQQENNSEWEIINPQHHNLDIHFTTNLNKTKQNTQFALDRLNTLLNMGQDFAKKYHEDPNMVKRGIQIAKLSMIGIMQLQQVILISNDQSILTQKISEEYDIRGTKEMINEFTLNLVLDYLNNNILTQLINSVQLLFQLITKDEHRKIVIYLSKLQSCLEILPTALEVSKNDLLALDRNHQDWIDLKDCIQIKLLGTQQQIEQAYDKLAEGLQLGNAMISKGSEYKGDFAQSFMQGFGAVFYLFAKKKARQRADHFMAEPDKNLAFKVWNLGEQGLLKALMPLLFQPITYNQKIYIPRMFKRITAENILEQYQQNTINQINNDVGYQLHNDQIPSQSEIYKKGLEKITIRILLSKLPQETNPSNIYQQTIKFMQGQYQFEQIIIHIHGGGFVSMSSRSHQTYTRKWANKLNVPIFSIDYRMAPEDPYPAGMDDCWQAYMFILSYIDRYFNIKPTRVALVGDSAGGNLVAALTVQTIKAGVRIPDGILLAYPALSLDIRTFTPSFLVALDDNLLHHTVLKLCLESYIPEGFDAKKDPLISPSRASDEILNRFPKCRIILGTYDPLHDESFRLVQRLHKLKRDVKLIEYQYMPHGFLSFDVINGMAQAAVTVKDATEILRELIH